MKLCAGSRPAFWAASLARDGGCSWEALVGQAAEFRWAESPALFVAAPATCPGVLRARIRLCRLPAGFPPSTRGAWCEIHRDGRASRLLRDRDRRGRRAGALGRTNPEHAGWAAGVRAEPLARGCRGAGGDQRRGVDRRDHRAACRGGRGRQHAQAAADLEGQGQDRSVGRPDARAVGRVGISGDRVGARRVNPCAASVVRSPRSAGQGANAREERGACGAGPQPVWPPAGDRLLWQEGPRVAGRTAAARRRATDARRVPAPGRFPRHRD